MSIVWTAKGDIRYSILALQRNVRQLSLLPSPLVGEGREARREATGVGIIPRPNEDNNLAL